MQPTPEIPSRHIAEDLAAIRELLTILTLAALAGAFYVLARAVVA